MGKSKNHIATRSYIIRINALLLLVLFAYFNLRSAFPYMEYMLRKDFIIKNLCVNRNQPEKECNGQCHLEKEIEKSVEEADNGELPPAPQNEKKELPVYVIDKLIDNQNHQVIVESGFEYHRSYTFQYVAEIFHPPMILEFPRYREIS